MHLYNVRTQNTTPCPPNLGKSSVALLQFTGTRSSGWPIGKRHYKVTLSDAVHANHICVEVFGGFHGKHDVEKLLGALGRPYHGYHKRIWTKGAALLHAIATSHGFADGNKRTSMLMLFLLYERSDYTLETREGDRWDDVVVDVVNGAMTQEQLELFLKDRTVRLDQNRES